MTRSRSAGTGTEEALNPGFFDAPGAGPDEAPDVSAGGPANAAAVSPCEDESAASPPPASFELAMAELESLVERMEGGRLPLEESLAAYQRGVVLVKYCREALGQVAQRVRILEADLLQPFDVVADDRDA